MSGLIPNVAAAGGATPDASITQLAQQHGVSRESLVGFVQSKLQQARQDSGQPPLDQATLDQIIDHALDRDRSRPDAGGESAPEPTASAGYTASAQQTARRPGASGSISILA